MDKVYFGLSETDDIIEICVCDMSVSELEHLKKELELQWVKRSAGKESLSRVVVRVAQEANSKKYLT